MLIPIEYPVCSCCLEMNALKTIWKASMWNGRREVYGDMLKECFHISWPLDRANDTICEICITRLRNAVFFKQRLLVARAKLDDLKENETDNMIDVKIQDDLLLQNDTCQQDDHDMKHDIVTVKIERDIIENDNQNVELKMEIMEDSDEIGPDTNNIELKADPVTRKLEVFDSMEISRIPYHKLPKVRSIRKNIKLTNYVVVDSISVPIGVNPAFSRSAGNTDEPRNIDNHANLKSIDSSDESRSTSNPAKSSSNSNPAKSSSASNSPKPSTSNSVKSRRTSNSAKSRSISNPAKSTTRIGKCDAIPAMNGVRSVYIRLRLNTCLLLVHSTLLPFKFNKGYIECFYCNKQHVNFEELKSHTTQNHIVNFDTISKSIIRPNSKVRVDATNIQCNLCDNTFMRIHGLIEHLIDEHDVKFNDSDKPDNCVIPYILGDGKFICYECKKEFAFFKTLSQHMNVHSTDNMCDTCGQCFLLPLRLKVHIAMHHDTPKSLKCDICGKVLPHKAALRGHVRYTHKKLSHLCLLCDIKFENNEQRLEHFQLVHKGVAINRNCQICFKKFGSVSGLNSHIRTSHSKRVVEAKFGCSDCDMKFSSKYKLKKHSLVHSQEKKYECDVCHKKFGRAYTLKEHLKIHFNDRRWSCRVCGQSFVQKCSLKSHIRVHHVECNADDAIVYIKT